MEKTAHNVPLSASILGQVFGYKNLFGYKFLTPRHVRFSPTNLVDYSKAVTNCNRRLS